MSIYLLGGLAILGQAFADDIEVKPPTNTPAVSSCPSTFFHVAVIENARQCQKFDDSLPSSLPASLVYFTQQSQQQVIAFYQQAHPSFTAVAPVNQRTLLAATDGSVRIIVSPDSKGTQVDVLIINTN